MKITTPEEMKGGLSKLDEAVGKFERQLKEEDKDQSFYSLVIEREYNREVCDEIEKIYKEAGWSVVCCRTSSENQEIPGLTALMLYG